MRAYVVCRCSPIRASISDNLSCPGQISVLLLRELDAQLRSVLVALIVKKMMQLRGAAEQQERMRDIHLARSGEATRG